MSLLNEMLKDLDHRKTHQPASLLIPSLNRHWVNSFPNMFVGLLILIVLSFVMYIISNQLSKPRPLSHVPESIVQAAAEPIILTSRLVPAPVFETQWNVKGTFPPILPELNTLEPEMSKQLSRQTPEEWHDEHLNHALEAMERGDDSQAIKLLELILTQFPASIEARENLAAIYLSFEEMARAYDVIDKGMKYDPHNLRLSIMKARLLVAQDQHQDALTLLKQFHPGIDKEPDYYGLLAAVFEGLGRTSEAGSLYQSLVKIEPENGRYWLGFAIALENKKANQQAIDAYKRASQSEASQSDVRAYAEDRLKILQG